MNVLGNILDKLSRLITVRPYVTLVVLLIVTVALASGTTLRAPPTEGANVAFLPPDHAIADVTREIEELFGDSGEISIVTLLFRGDAITPDGLAQMDALIGEIVSEPRVSELLVPVGAVVAPSSIIGSLAQAQGLDGINQAVIAAALSLPEIAGAIDALTGIDEDGTQVAIANIRLGDTGEERIQDAERWIHELADEHEGPLRVSSLSSTIVEDEYKQATESGMAPLIGLALLLIALLLLLFTRTVSDMLLTLIGLIVSITWIVGAEGWLGPNGLSLIGPPSSLTAMIPVIVISLTVDYAIQAISHYREQRLEGLLVVQAVQTGLRHVTIPLTLAAVTTIVSFLATLFSPIGVIGDFGIVAGLGVGLSLMVMLTLIPAGRAIIDRRREARDKLTPPRPISNALPGITPIAELLGKSVTRWPVPFLLAVIAATTGLGFAATGLKSEFSVRDILPRGGSVLRDMDTLDSAVGGSTEVASLLVKAEVTEIRTLLNLNDLSTAFEDEHRRPGAAAGPIQTSYHLHMLDWIDDSGEPGDKYDPELAAIFREATAGVALEPDLMQDLIDELVAREPELARFLINDPGGIDTMLLQFPTDPGDPGQTGMMQEEIEALWLGDDSAITATSDQIIAVAVQNQITDRQTEAIGTTIAMALSILSIFFWVTLRQPMLGIIAVGPIVLVLICVLGTMALLSIPYSLITSIITALSIGIGVDYTIHVIHRYREEFSRSRDPERAAIRTLMTTGSALLGSALTTALGFGVLIASPLLASQQFGITATITIVYSLMVSVFVVLPAMVVWGAYQNMRLRSMVEREWEELDVAIEGIHQEYEQEKDSA